ncbi:transporter substrate-binding domain-containing protein, partial [Methylobacterium radiotolerans]|uniref:transporter substrate-binding domain-containing protein n=1 Tax=Methylobacterium radiotolerans TaxID=31998 RepID=UPI001FDA192F
SMRTPSGELDGLEVRVMREVCRRLGLEDSPVNSKFDALLVGLMADQYEITSQCMDITPHRPTRRTEEQRGGTGGTETCKQTWEAER